MRARFNASFPSQHDARVRLPFHALLRVPARPQNQPDKVIPRILVLWHVQLSLLLPRPPIVRRLKLPGFRVRHQPLDELVALAIQLILHPRLARVHLDAEPVILRRRRRTPIALRPFVHEIPHRQPLLHVLIFREPPRRLRIIRLQRSKRVRRHHALGRQVRVNRRRVRQRHPGPEPLARVRAVVTAIARRRVPSRLSLALPSPRVVVVAAAVAHRRSSPTARSFSPSPRVARPVPSRRDPRDLAVSPPLASTRARACRVSRRASPRRGIRRFIRSDAVPKSDPHCLRTRVGR